MSVLIGPKLYIPLNKCKGYKIDGIDYFMESHGDDWDVFMSKRHETPFIGTISCQKHGRSKIFDGKLKDSPKVFKGYRSVYDIIRAMVCNKFFEEK